MLEMLQLLSCFVFGCFESLCFEEFAIYQPTYSYVFMHYHGIDMTAVTSQTALSRS